MNFFTYFLFVCCWVIGYNSLLGPNRRYSCSFGRHKSNSVESSRIFSAYPMGGSFGIDDYFIESDDGEEADDEFDQITNSADVEEKVNQYQLSVPTRVSCNITSVFFDIFFLQCIKISNISNLGNRIASL